MRAMLGALAIALLLTGCSGDNEPKEDDGSKETPVESAVDLATACPQIEAAWGTREALVTKEVLDLLTELGETGDVETKNAATAFRQVIDQEFRISSEAVGNGDTFISPDGEDRIKEAIRGRCEAVGSSAFA